jgi:WD40 repeat protein
MSESPVNAPRQASRSPWVWLLVGGVGVVLAAGAFIVYSLFQQNGDAGQQPEPREIAVGKPVASREAELEPAGDRGLAAYLRTPWQEDEDLDSIAFSPDGTLLAVGFKAGLSLWEVVTGKCRTTVRFMPTNAARYCGLPSIAFSPDGSLLAAGDDRRIYLYRVKTREQQHLLEEPAKDASFALFRFAGNGSMLVTLNSKGEIRLWSTEKGESLRVLPEQAHRDIFGATDLRGTPDGETVVFTATSDKKLVHMELATGKVLKRWLAHPENGRNLLGFTANGKGLVSTGKEGRLMRWDLDSDKAGRSLASLEDAVDHLAISPDGKLAAVSSPLAIVEFYDLATGRKRGQVAPLGFTSLKGLAFGPTGKTIAAIAGKKIYLWDLDLCAYDRAIVLKDESGRIAGAANGLLAVEAPEKLLVYDTATGDVKHTVPWKGALFGLALDRGQHLAAAGDVATVFELGKDKKRDAFPANEHTVMALSPDGKSLARTVDLQIKLEANGATEVLTCHGNKVRALAFSPDGRWLASGGDDGKIIVWEPAAKTKLKWEFDAHEQSVEHLAFSGDGLLLASAGGADDRTLRLWDLALGKKKATLKSDDPENDHTGLGFLTGMLLSPDGKHILTAASTAKVMHLWDVGTGKAARHVYGHDEPVAALTALGPNRLATTDKKNIIMWSWDRLVQLPPDYRPPPAKKS